MAVSTENVCSTQFHLWIHIFLYDFVIKAILYLNAAKKSSFQIRLCFGIVSVVSKDELHKSIIALTVALISVVTLQSVHQLF